MGNESQINSKFSIGIPASLPGGERYSPESVRNLANVQPDEGHNLRTGMEVKNQLEDPADQLSAQIAEQVARLLSEERGESSSSFFALTDILAKERLPKDPEKLNQIYRGFTVDAMGLLITDVKGIRLNMVADQFGLQRHGATLDQMTNRLESTLSKHVSVDKLKPEVQPLAKVLMADMARFGGIEKMVEHASVFQMFYYDGLYMYGALASGRRIKVLGTDDLRLIFGNLKGLDLKGVEPSEEIGEGAGETLRKMVANQIHFDMAIASLNRFNPNKPAGQETEMKMSETERAFLGSLFKKDGNKTKEITVNGKTFQTNLLSFYLTTDKEKERKTSESLMQALHVHDAKDILDSIGEDPTKFTAPDDAKYKDLLSKVQKTAKEIENGWDSFISTPKARLAKWAGEIAFTTNIATLNVNDLAYGFEWEQDKKDKSWQFKPAIAGPNTGYDAVNIWLSMQHELEYMLKARVRTPAFPGVASDQAWDFIRKIVVEKEDPKIKSEILKDRGLMLGAAILGMYEGEIKLNEKDQTEVDNIRGARFAKGDTTKMMSFNTVALKVLEKSIFGYPTWVEGKVLPIPIRGMFNGINLLKTMVVDPKAGKTVFDKLNEGETLASDSIDFENQSPYVVDSWHVNLKMLGDVMRLMYGQGDKKTQESYFAGSASEGLGTLIKKMDIGTRGEYVPMDLGETEGDGVTPKLTNIPRPFYEIVYTAYAVVSHLAFVDHGIWDAGGKWRGLDPTLFWDGNGSKKGVKQWVEAAYTSLPDNKGSFDHYRDSMVLMIEAIAQWMVSIAPAAEKLGAKQQDEATMPFTSSFDALKTLNNKR
ncbi:MAG: hypothetical protein QY322_03150 [bacterium]|nr:MAG: hypothetical protein QY322_03150 [bacterium]